MTLGTQDQVAPLADPLPALGHEPRLAELARTAVAGGRTDEIFDRFARLAALMLSAPVSYVSLVGHDRQVHPGAVWLDRNEEPARVLPLPQSVCAFSVATGDETVIEDMAVDPLVRDNPALQALDVRSYAGYPLTTEDGHVLGNLCVLDREARRWTEEELTSLRDLASLVLQELQHRITRTRLAALRDEVAAVLAEVPPARESVRLLAEAARSSDDPRLQRTAAVAVSRIDRLMRAASGVHDELDDSEVDEETMEFDLVGTLRRAVGGMRAVTGSALPLFVAPEVDVVVLEGDALALERALSHVFVMVVHHARDETPAVALFAEDRRVVLTVSAPGAQVPTSHLGRAVARLDHAVRPVTVGGAGGQRRAAVQLSAGIARVTAGDVEGVVSADGLVMRASWPA